MYQLLISMLKFSKFIAAICVYSRPCALWILPGVIRSNSADDKTPKLRASRVSQIFGRQEVRSWPLSVYSLVQWLTAFWPVSWENSSNILSEWGQGCCQLRGPIKRPPNGNGIDEITGVRTTCMRADLDWFKKKKKKRNKMLRKKLYLYKCKRGHFFYQSNQFSKFLIPKRSSE